MCDSRCVVRCSTETVYCIVMMTFQGALQQTCTNVMSSFLQLFSVVIFHSRHTDDGWTIWMNGGVYNIRIKYPLHVSSDKSAWPSALPK